MFSCLSKWLDFGIPVIKVESLFDYLFHSLNNENIFDDASNCIIALFTSPDAIKWDENSIDDQSIRLILLRYPTVFSRLLPYILQLESILDQALISGDKVKRFVFVFLFTFFFSIKDKAECITKLITQYGENFAQLIIQLAIAPHQQSQTLSHRFCCLLMVNKKGDVEVFSSFQRQILV